MKIYVVFLVFLNLFAATTSMNTPNSSESEAKGVQDTPVEAQSFIGAVTNKDCNTFYFIPLTKETYLERGHRSRCKVESNQSIVKSVGNCKNDLLMKLKTCKQRMIYADIISAIKVRHRHSLQKLPTTNLKIPEGITFSDYKDSLISQKFNITTTGDLSIEDIIANKNVELEIGKDDLNGPVLVPCKVIREGGINSKMVQILIALETDDLYFFVRSNTNWSKVFNNKEELHAVAVFNRYKNYRLPEVGIKPDIIENIDTKTVNEGGFCTTIWQGRK